MIKPNDYQIPDNEFNKEAQVLVDGVPVSRGLVPRDYGKNPIEVGNAFDPQKMPLIAREEWSGRINDMAAGKMQLSDIRMRGGHNGEMIDALDQNGEGYCWFYSGTAGIQLARAASGMPYVPLSAHSGAWVIKKGRNQGGWGAAGVEFQTKRGVCTQADWPAKSMNGQKHNTNDNWSRAKEFRVDESWMEISPPAWDRDMTFDQVASCLLSTVPVVGDFNHWGHSVILMDLVEVDPNRDLMDINRWGVRLLNSWSNRWGYNGTGILKGRKAVPDGGCAIRSVWGA